MPKKNASGLTRPKKSRSERLLAHFDIIDRHRQAAETIAGLLGHCYGSDQVDPEVVSDAGGLIRDELGKMRDQMSVMYQEALKK